MLGLTKKVSEYSFPVIDKMMIIPAAAVTTIVVGYPDEDPPKRDRLPLAAFLHDETYHRPDEAELEGIYEQREVKGWARYMAHPELRAKVEELGITSLAQFYTSEAKYDPVLAAINPNLRDFKARGGKLIQLHGWDDQLISPQNSIDYYESVIAFEANAARDRAAAARDVQNFFRLFMVPGMTHCGGGSGPTNYDAQAALEGSMLPVGGTKGAMLAMIVELLACALTGAAMGFEADSFFVDAGNQPRIGQAFLVIDPDALAGHDAYFDRIEALIEAMLADEGVRLPGARRDALSAKAGKEGIEISQALANQLTQLAG